MSARIDPKARALARVGERDAFAAMLARHAPRGGVRVAEALAAAAMNRRRRRVRLWNGAFADVPQTFDVTFAGLPEQPVSATANGGADAVWGAACRRIAARALAGAGPDPIAGAHCAAPADAPPPPCMLLTARIGAYAFFRDADRIG